MPAFAITSLGCKVNQYDAQAIAKACREGGFLPVRRGESADLAVVVTCCVTATAAAKSRQAIRRALRKHPRARLAVLGCYVAYHADRIRNLLAEMHLPEDRILLASSHDDLARQLNLFLRGNAPPGPAENHAPLPVGPDTLKPRRNRIARQKSPGLAGLPRIDRFAGHQRAFVKIQDGCDAFCSYCVVPYTRPVPTSRAPDDVLRECRDLITAGHREIVLCGVFLGAYLRSSARRDRWANTPSRLPKLLRDVAGLPGLWRVRLSSLEPADLTEDLLDTIAEHPRVAPHLHLPAQSGSDRILTAMRRQYAAADLQNAFDTLNKRLDRPALSTDLIVGFPGETEEDFRRTLDLVRAAGFMKLHVFPFSPVEPTAAWQRRNEAPPQKIVRERIDRLNDLGNELATAYRKQFPGSELQGIVESTRPRAGFRQAMTDRYLTVVFPEPPGTDFTGQIVTLDIRETTPTGLAGMIV